MLMKKPTVVYAADGVIRAIRKGLVPVHIADKFFKWKMDVQGMGIREVRKVTGYHDEPVKGSEIGRRSVRLNQAWRLFYVESETGEFYVVAVEEINHHEYK
jgi:proteic killer suppression protein